MQWALDDHNGFFESGDVSFGKLELGKVNFGKLELGKVNFDILDISDLWKSEIEHWNDKRS